MLELLINGKQADIKDESIIAVTKTYESVSNPLNYYADYSKTIKLPISRRNNDIFANFNRLDNIVTNVTIDPTKKLPFILLWNQEPVMEGYLKLENANTIWTDEEYNVTLFSTFGLVMNELKLLTFNPNAQDVDPKYIIDSPFADELKIDRNLIKQSFEQTRHNVNGNTVMDWIGFIPTYQGKYADFASDRVQLLPSGRTDDMSRERDEHYTREFRSYYQQPFIWVDKLWKCAKEKIDSITDYTMVLDDSWFMAGNPYYQDLIYTCPNLYNSGTTTTIEETQSFTPTSSQLAVHQYNRNANDRLNTHRTFWLNNLTSNSGDIYDANSGIFNANSDKGSTKFNATFDFTLFAYQLYINGMWAKIRKDNPFYVKFKAVDLTTNQDIFGASKTFLIYSDDNNANTATYDEAVDLGISQRYDFPSSMSSRTPLYTGSDGYVWHKTINVQLNITENTPYKIGVEIWNLNNSKPFEWISSNPTLTPTWDWLWADFFDTGNNKGYSMWFDTLAATVETTENNRSGSNISLYKIFPKETTLYDVLLNYSKMFGLCWKIDDYEKTVTVMTRDKFFSTYHIEDWSDKIDRSKEFKFNPLTFDKRYVEFNFNNGECGRLKQYDDFYELAYGTKKLDTEYDFNTDTNKLFDKLTPSVIAQKKQFSKMMNTEYEDRPNFMGYSYMVYPQEHFVDNDNNGENAGMSGAFYFRNGTFHPDAQLSGWDDDGTYCFNITDDTDHQIKTGEYSWNASGENTTFGYKFPDISTISNKYGDYNFSVHFAAPKEYYFDNSGIGEVKYIYDTFWKDYINERYCSQNKKLTAYVYLTIEEFKNLDFTEFVTIDNVLYHVDKVYDFNFNSDYPVKMDLVQVWNINAYLGSGSPFPYIYTDYQQYVLDNNSISIPVHASGSWTATVFDGSWLTATASSNNLLLSAQATTYMRLARVILNLTGTNLNWILTVSQTDTIGRLNVTPETLVFGQLGGTKEVIIDSSNLTNNAITIASSASWLTANITEYHDSIPASTPVIAKRSHLTMIVTAAPCTRAVGRNATLTLTMDNQGSTYTAVVHVGQQCGSGHRMNNEARIITDITDYQIYDDTHTRVYSLTAGNEYTFTDYLPEQIDVNSISITNGTVSVSGNSGEQTITFTPQLSDGDEVGGGVITATTLNGNIISWPYNVSTSTPAPTKRRVIIKSNKAQGRFSVSVPGTSKITDYFEMNLNDGTYLKLIALPNEGYTLSKWIINGDLSYTTPQLNLTVGSDITGDNGTIAIKLDFKQSQNTVTITLISPSDGYITIGNDTTHYTNVTRTVVAGTALTNVKATANSGVRPFKNWSDGSTANPRDIIVTKDTTISAVYGGQLVSQSMIYLDGSGLIGGNDTVTVRFDGSDVLKCGVGQQDSKKISEATYVLDLICDINDLASKFNNFTIGSTSYYTNPYTNQSFNLSDDTTFAVKTIPSALYYANENLFDTIKGNDQSALVNGQFRKSDLDVEVSVETNYEAEFTAAIPTDYKINKILNENGDNILEEEGYFTIEKSENENWFAIYTDRGSESESYTFILELA